jgi:hypothetical protein
MDSDLRMRLNPTLREPKSRVKKKVKWNLKKKRSSS